MATRGTEKKASELGLRLIVTTPVADTDEDTATKFADLLIKRYDEMSDKGIGGLSFSNCIEIERDYPEERHVVRAVEILKARGWSADPNDYSTVGVRRGAVWMSPNDPHR